MAVGTGDMSVVESAADEDLSTGLDSGEIEDGLIQDLRPEELLGAGSPEELEEYLDDDDDDEDLGDEEVEDEEEEDEEDEESSEEESPPPKGAQKRIQDLVAQRNEEREARAKQEQYFQQQLQQQQQMLQQMQWQAQQAEAERQRQIEFQEEQIRLLSARDEKEALEKMDPVARYEKELVDRAYKRAEGTFRTELDELKGQLETERAQRAQAAQQHRENIERQQRYNSYDSQATAVIERDFPQAVDDPELSEMLKEGLLTLSASYGVLPEQAASRFQNLAQKLAGNYAKTASKEKGKRVKEARKLPGSKRRRGSSSDDAGGLAWKKAPPMSKLREAGFNDPFDWREAGAPDLG